MSSEEDGPDERVLESLPHELAPPAALETRVVAELRRRRLTVGGTGATRRRLALAAGWLLAFAVGLVAGGRYQVPAPGARNGGDGGRYLLLLYEPRPLDRGDGDDLVAEYGAWARELSRRGQLLAAEKLNHEERRLGAASVAPGARPAGGDEPTGFFLIRAGTFEEAMEIANRCPHLARGGEVAVRPIDPT